MKSIELVLSTAGVIWLCACVRYWPYRGVGTCALSARFGCFLYVSACVGPTSWIYVWYDGHFRDFNLPWIRETPSVDPHYNNQCKYRNDDYKNFVPILCYPFVSGICFFCLVLQFIQVITCGGKNTWTCNSLATDTLKMKQLTTAIKKQLSQ